MNMFLAQNCPDLYALAQEQVDALIELRECAEGLVMVEWEAGWRVLNNEDGKEVFLDMRNDILAWQQAAFAHAGAVLMKRWAYVDSYEAGETHHERLLCAKYGLEDNSTEKFAVAEKTWEELNANPEFDIRVTRPIQHFITGARQLIQQEIDTLVLDTKD